VAEFASLSMLVKEVAQMAGSAIIERYGVLRVMTYGGGLTRSIGSDGRALLQERDIVALRHRIKHQLMAREA
jgi:hypothetical protein